MTDFASCCGVELELLPMPSEMVLCWPDRLIARQQQSLSVKLRQRLLIGTGFGKRILRHDDSVLVVDAPESRVKQPVRVLGECQSIARIVIPRVRELVNVRCIDDRLASNRRNAIAGERARVVVSRNNIEAKASVAPGDLGIVWRFVICVFGNLIVSWNRHSDKVVQRISLGWLKVLRDEDAPSLLPECGASACGDERRIRNDIPRH